MIFEEPKTKTKALALLASVMMLVTGLIIVSTSEESDADPAGYYAQNVNVFYYQNNAWQHSTQGAYNLYEALVGAATNTGLTPVVATGNGSWVSGYNPNEFYGVLTGLNDSSDNPVTGYSILAWDGSTWQDVTNAPLGWIRPFADYGSTVVIPGLSFSASANVAIVLSGQTLSVDAGDLLTMPTDLTIYSNTLYKFTLCDASNSLAFTNKTVKLYNNGTPTVSTISSSAIQNGNQVVICGYGSDAYLALIDALCGNLISDNLVSMNSDQIYAWVGHSAYNPDGTFKGYYNTYYSWMGSVFGYGTVTIPLGNDQYEYHYWASYVGNDYSTVDPWTDYLEFNYGYYSQLYGCYNNFGNEFVLAYEVS